MYLDILTHITADELYEDALNSLVRLQVATSSDPNFLPPYDAELLCSEMELFRIWYLPKHRKLEITPEISDVLDRTFEFLRDRALEQPKVWVHLDYHSRNLMHVADNNPGIIDFQSAVLGPITYEPRFPVARLLHRLAAGARSTLDTPIFQFGTRCRITS